LPLSEKVRIQVYLPDLVAPATEGKPPMKCQACNKAATHHVTEIDSGKPVEYHVCDAHLPDLDALKSAAGANKPATGYGAFLDDPEIREALRDPVAREKMAGCLLPALCLALLDHKPELRVVSAFRLMQLGPNAKSALGALRDALHDPDERVRKAAGIAIEYIETEQDQPWFF
jgi:hypothetical protein